MIIILYGARQGLQDPEISFAFKLSHSNAMQDPETVCNTKQTLMSSLNLQEEKLSLAEECSTGEQER